MTSARLTEHFFPSISLQLYIKAVFEQKSIKWGMYFFSGSLLIPVGEKVCEEVIMSAHLIFISWDSSAKEKIHTTSF